MELIQELFEEAGNVKKMDRHVAECFLMKGTKNGGEKTAQTEG